MIEPILTCLFWVLLCAALYSIKGGQHVSLRLLWAKFLGVDLDENKSAVDAPIHKYILYEVTDGTILSSILFGLVAALYFPDQNLIAAFLLPFLGWLFCVAPSMGEEASGIGGIEGNSGPYKDMKGHKSFNYAFKKGIQRGIFGALMIACGLAAADIPLNIWPLIIAGATFPLAYYIGISIEQIRLNIVAAPWHWAEPIHGATLGLGIAISILTA